MPVGFVQGLFCPRGSSLLVVNLVLDSIILGSLVTKVGRLQEGSLGF
jgi:hypothetical protein